MSLIVSEQRQKELKSEAGSMQSWDLTRRQICDTELLINGGFAPLTGFLGQDDYQSVLDTTRLSSGEVWPMPICLDVDEAFAAKIELGDKVALRDQEGVLIAVLTVESNWQPNKTEEAEKVFGSSDLKHPAVDYLMNRAGYSLFGRYSRRRRVANPL